MSLLLRAARIFDGEAFLEDAALRIEGGRVLAAGAGLDPLPGEELRELGSAWILPGLVDCHVHFREPGLERKEGWAHGSAGALHGGVTTVLEIQNNPPLLTRLEILEAKLRLAEAKSRVDFGAYGNLVEEALPELEALARRTPALKCFLGCSTGAAGVPDEATLLRLFEAAARAGAKVVAHCEDDEVMRRNAEALRGTPAATLHHRIRDEEAEVRSIETALRAAERTGVRLHVFHLSTARGASLVAEAGASGLPVSGSTGPAYLLLSWEEVEALGQNRLKVNPAIKSAADRDGLAALLAEGRIACLGTDHAPHPLEEKARPYAKAPSGFPQVDLFLPLLFEVARRHGLPLERVLRAATADAAREFGIPGKGRLRPGADADFVILDPEEERSVDESRLLSRSGWSPFHGWRLRGFPREVWLRGEPALRDGRVLGPPRGRSLW